MAKQNITTAMSSMKIGSADKKVLTALFNNLVDDVESLRGAIAALNTKLDANHAVASDHAATITVAKSALAIAK